MRAFLVAALGLLTASCLDFDRYGESAGGAGAGGGSEGGGGAGGGSGGAPSCGGGPVPTAVCITGALYDFNAPFGGDWAWTEIGIVGNGCGGQCAELTLNAARLDLRTTVSGMADDCYASVAITSSTGDRTFLELVPDGPDMGGTIPEADLAQNVEVAVEDDIVRFRVAGVTIPVLTLPPETLIDVLRIQVRESTVVLEALAAGQVMACHEAAKPTVLAGQVRAGFGLQGSSGQTATFDNYGVTP